MNSSKSLGALCAALLTLAIASQAFAHILLETPQATPGRAFKAIFSVPHGCHGKATTALKIDIPGGIIGAKPMPKPGWTLSKARGAHGAEAEGVTSVTWADGNLPNDEYDEFVISVHLAATLTPGTTVYFPVVQSCGDQTMAWTDVPQAAQMAADLKMPAPGLLVLAGAAPQSPATTMAGSLEIATPWLRATPNGAKVAGGYLSITNKGTEPDRLTGAVIPVAAKGAIHKMSMDNGMMLMRELTDGLEIKPGETVELKPGGYHLMFEDLKQPLKQGDTVEGTLTFAKAGTVAVTFKVGGIADTVPPAAATEPMHMH
jgi:periplasmic copper chaperone A